MTELERRNFLLWTAGSAFTLLTAFFARQGRAAVDALLDPSLGRSGGDAQSPGMTAGGGAKPATPPASGPASKPASKDAQLKPGPQEDGSFVLDPANPPAPALKQEKGKPNGFYVKVGDDAVLVAQKDGKKGWVAIAAVCTHKKCSINYEPDKNDFKCPCHGSTFSDAGKVQKGPAKEDLKAFATSEVKAPGGKTWVRIAKK